MIPILLALFGHAVAICHPPAAVDLVVLKEDYQVLQRDASDRASCVVLLAKSTDRAARIVVTVEDGIGHILRRIDSSPISSGAMGLGIVVEGLETGGPYTITVTVKDHPARPPVQFRRILVGDIWVLGGQSNMYGIDVIKEPLPELPYLNMLNLLHVERDAHWCAGVPPIHRIPESLAPFVIKGQHPEYSEEKVRSIVASKIPIGGIDCSYFFARKLHALSGVPIGLIPCAYGRGTGHMGPSRSRRQSLWISAPPCDGRGGKGEGGSVFPGGTRRDFWRQGSDRQDAVADRTGVDLRRTVHPICRGAPHGLPRSDHARDLRTDLPAS